jgi:hypothetical protein
MSKDCEQNAVVQDRLSWQCPAMIDFNMEAWTAGGVDNGSETAGHNGILES